MRKIWKIIAWISILCGLTAYILGWISLIKKTYILIPTEFWFYDAIAAAMFGVFFLIYSAHSK